MRWRSLLLVSTLLAGCSGAFVNVAPLPPDGALPTGQGAGSACGVNLMGVIPINVNDRAERAYKQALEQAGGASGLTDTKVTDRWYWIYIGELFCTDVEGMGYRLSEAH